MDVDTFADSNYDVPIVVLRLNSSILDSFYMRNICVMSYDLRGTCYDMFYKFINSPSMYYKTKIIFPCYVTIIKTIYIIKSNSLIYCISHTVCSYL